MSKIEQMEITCIECPIGCHLVVTKDEKGEVTVTGNLCPRGEAYGKQEMFHPKRMITTVKNTLTGTISLKTSESVDKEKYFDILLAIKNTPLKKDYKSGDIFISNVCDSGADIVVTGVHLI